jgi:(p)ppGpp synthase/HD superfamily hydrolase
MSKALKPREIYGIAYQIAEKAHAGQFRELPDGRAYIEHCKDVAAMMPTWELKTVAILHDTIEDTREKPEAERVTPELLLSKGIPAKLVEAVVAMTKPVGIEDYLAYVRDHVLPNEMARKVKLADNYVNLKDRLAAVIAGGPEAEYARKKVKEYVGSIQVLIGG